MPLTRPAYAFSCWMFCSLALLTGCPQTNDPVDTTPDTPVDRTDATADVPDEPMDVLPDEVEDEGEDEGEEDTSTTALALTSLSPQAGPAAGGTSVTLTGGGFDASTKVFFAGVEAADVSVASAQSLSVTTPAGTAGAVDVKITRGDGQEATLVGAFTYEGVQPPRISFCQLQAQSPITMTTGQDSETLYAVVFAEGVTDAPGQGADIQMQIGWIFSEGPVDTFTYRDMTYNVDKDGLVPGDTANDEYAGALSDIFNAGTYGYVARGRIDNGEWFYCDLDGNNGADEPFELDQAGVVTVTDPAAAPAPDRCAIQFPSIIAQAELNQPLSFFGRVFEAGVTDVGDDDPNVRMELLVGPVDADPVTMPSVFAVVPATFQGQINGDEDEYVATWTPTVTGAFKFLFRASVNGGTDTVLCDSDDSTGPASFNNARTGFVRVAQTPEDIVDYCHVFQSMVTDSLMDPSLPIFTMEAYEAGVTDAANGGANAADLSVELGYGALGDNPAFDGVYTWTGAPFARVVGNNYEYEGDPYGAQPPAVGGYGVVARVKRVGTTAWQYCDHDNTTMEFLPNSVSTLSVSP